MAPSSSRELWAAERARWKDSSNLAADIHAALSYPTAAGIFHAKLAMIRCSMLAGIGVASVSTKNPGLARATRQCENVADQLGQFQSQYSAARLSPEERALLDAADGTGSYAGVPLRVRFDAVAPIEDPFLSERVGRDWLIQRDAHFDGRPLSSEQRSEMANAWAIAACTEAGTCDTSVGAARLCKVFDQCEGTLQQRMSHVHDEKEMDAIRGFTEIVRDAMRSRDYSRFE